MSSADSDNPLSWTPGGKRWRQALVQQAAQARADTDSNADTPPMTINPNTKVTIGLVVTILTVGIGATWKLSNVIRDESASFRDEITGVKGRVDELKSSLDSIKAERFTVASASEHALRTAMENPGMRIPDPRDPSKVFVVDIARKP